MQALVSSLILGPGTTQTIDCFYFLAKYSTTLSDTTIHTDINSTEYSLYGGAVLITGADPYINLPSGSAYV